MNIINYELFGNPNMLYVISYMGLFIVLVILGGLLTDLLTYPDSPSYFFRCTSIYNYSSCMYLHLCKNHTRHRYYIRSKNYIRKHTG